jgi:hypothetical protein
LHLAADPLRVCGDIFLGFAADLVGDVGEGFEARFEELAQGAVARPLRLLFRSGGSLAG